jgi:hypothetical protein
MRIIMGAILVLLGVDAARAATVAPVMACQQLTTRCGFPAPASPVERERSVEDAESTR